MNKPSTTRWLYFMSHDEESEFEWRDIHLLPDDETWEGDALWLTVSALGPLEEEDEPVLRAHIERHMGQDNHWLDQDDLDLYVRSDRLTGESLLKWVNVALAELGYECGELVRGTDEQFAGRSEQLASLGSAAGLVDALMPNSSTADEGATDELDDFLTEQLTEPEGRSDYLTDAARCFLRKGGTQPPAHLSFARCVGDIVEAMGLRLQAVTREVGIPDERSVQIFRDGAPIRLDELSVILRRLGMDMRFDAG